MAKSKKNHLTIPVSFGRVSFGDATANVPITIDRDNLTLDHAETHLCGRRLSCNITIQHNGNPDQQQLPGVEDALPSVTGVADVKGYRSEPKAFHASLTFAISEIDVKTLAQFAAKTNGQLLVTEVGALPEKAAGGSGEDDGSE